ncbi:MAG TPA: 4Fe-4S binding protein [Polyangia bacterium]|jgi:Ni,Fe-hydrogenase III small subunit/formate hydrogenlyase subunit 6/NADH:ubiquinone oxidoreductase subunit I
MLNLLKARFRQGTRTIAFPPAELPALPACFRGRPRLAPARCPTGCAECAAVCPTGAVSAAPLALDLGLCLFCGLCAEACPHDALAFTPDHRLATAQRADLRLAGDELRLAAALAARTRALFGRSLKLRQVSAGGCNGCEAELNAAGNIVFDLGRFGIQFVASPRHADGVVVTGPVTANMRQALLDTYAAVPSPRLVVAVGACAIGGGPFRGSPACHDGVPAELPIDLYLPGCPPHPLTVMDGLLRVLGRLR